jgi:hypothetical protein
VTYFFGKANDCMDTGELTENSVAGCGWGFMSYNQLIIKYSLKSFLVLSTQEIKFS